MTKNQIAIFLSFCLIGLGSCDPDFFETNCDNCFQDKPVEGLLAVKLSYDGLNGIPIKIYQSRQVEKGELIIVDTIKQDIAEFWVDVGDFYSVEAEYTVGTRTVKVIHGDKVSVFLDDTNCDVTCWRPNDGIADCRIK